MSLDNFAKIAGGISLLALALTVVLVLSYFLLGSEVGLVPALVAFAASIVSLVSGFVGWRHLRFDAHHEQRQQYLRSH